MSYKPTFSQSLSLDGLKRWISSELVRISNAFIKNSQQTQITVSTEAPAKPQTGQVVFADGTIWNPSDGRGLYYYDTNTWQFFGSGGGGGGGGGSFTETNDLTASVSWTPVPDSYITQSSVTQHQSQLSISETQIHDLQSYLTTETDPIFSAHAASGITSTQILNWDTAYGWGNHSTQGYLTSHQDISGKADLNSSPTFTGTITAPSLNITGTGTVDGRDVSVDGARLDTIPYYRIRYDKVRHSALELYLTTSYQNLSQATSIFSLATPVKCARYIDIQTEVEWRYVSSNTNDLYFKLELIVPTSTATVTDLGTATAGTFSGFTRDTYESWFYVSGDCTHLLTEFGRMNKTGVSGATEMQARAWHYQPHNDRTYILTDSNPGISVSTGDTIYWHPYAWEQAGTVLYVEEQIDERYVSYGRQHINLKFKTAYDDSRILYRAFMREQSTADSAVIYDVKATLTEIEEV